MHFKICSLKVDFVRVSIVITVYSIIIAAYHAHCSLVTAHSFPEDSIERSTATLDYTIRLLIQLSAIVFLAWGFLGRQSIGLLIWLFIACCFVVRDTTSKIQYLLQDKVEVGLTENIMEWVIIVLDALAVFFIFNFFFCLREDSSYKEKLNFQLKIDRFHFKICSLNFSYVKLSIAIAIYTILICSYQLFVFLISSSEEILNSHKTIILWFNAEKLVVQVILAILLIYGALQKKTFALLSWTCISLALLATIKMGDDLIVIRENGRVFKILPDPLLYVLCVIDALAIFLVFNFFLNVKDSNARQKKSLQALILE